MIDKLLELNDDELKEQFIKYFGEEKWNQEEALTKLWPLELYICNDLGIDPIPVIVEDIIEDARYYDKENYIAISSNLIMDEIEAIKCLLHELRHAYQIVCVTRNDSIEPLVNIWKEDLSKPINLLSYDEQLCLSVEIDAYAYQKYMLKLLYDIDWHYLDSVYDGIISLYMIKYMN